MKFQLVRLMFQVLWKLTRPDLVVLASHWTLCCRRTHHLTFKHFMMFHPGTFPSHHNPSNPESWEWQTLPPPNLDTTFCLVLLLHVTPPWASSFDIILRTSYALSNPQNDCIPGLACWVDFDKSFSLWLLVCLCSPLLIHLFITCYEPVPIRDPGDTTRSLPPTNAQSKGKDI